MHNLQKEILHILQEDKSNESILNKLSKYQSILLKNHSNPVLDNEDKVKILNIYNKLQELGNSLYRYDMLKKNNLSEDAQVEKENLENVVLKGKITNVRYIWHSEQGENTCEECLDLDGQEFDTFDEIPKRPHPNCKCVVDIVDIDDENLLENEEVNVRQKEQTLGNEPQKEPKNLSTDEKWSMPCEGAITSPYGWRIHPVYKTGKMHNGWDIGVPVGTPVKSVADGKVYYAGRASGYGKMVVIVHNVNGKVVTSEYGHISSWSVYAGQQIKQGQVIAKSGNEGTSSGPHVHITIREGIYRGTAVDPNKYIRH